MVKRWWRKMEDFCENTVSLWERGTDKTMNSHNERGKTKKFLKLSWKRPLLCKTRDFHDWIELRTSRQCKLPMQVAKNPYETFWEICLTIFHDWKVHLRVSHEGNRETVWVNSRLELPLTNQSPIRVAKMLKTQNFENFLSIFCDWGYDSPESCQELLSKLAIRSTQLDWLVRVSRQNRVAKFLKFLNFFQNKNNFQKQLKHSKTHHTIWLFWINTSYFEIDA